jgi:hypothetical protein
VRSQESRQQRSLPRDLQSATRGNFTPRPPALRVDNDAWMPCAESPVDPGPQRQRWLGIPSTRKKVAEPAVAALSVLDVAHSTRDRHESGLHGPRTYAGAPTRIERFRSQQQRLSDACSLPSKVAYNTPTRRILETIHRPSPRYNSATTHAPHPQRLDIVASRNPQSTQGKVP